MRTRIPIKKLSDIVKNPDVRVEFTPDYHQDYLDFQEICFSRKLNMTIFSRHILLVWKRKFSQVADIEFKNKMLGEVIQSIHGIEQTDVFSKYETWENIEVPTHIVSKKDAKKIIKSPNKVHDYVRKQKTAPKKPGKVAKK